MRVPCAGRANGLRISTESHAVDQVDGAAKLGVQ